MNERIYVALLGSIAVAFSLFFIITAVPALAPDWDLVSAIAGGFVNPFAAGYSTDVILCWLVLAIWVYSDHKTKGIKHGWVCLLLGAVPGVAVGFALYLIMRSKQLKGLWVSWSVPIRFYITSRSSRQPYAPKLVVHVLRTLLHNQLLHYGLRLNSSVRCYEKH